MTFGVIGNITKETLATAVTALLDIAQRSSVAVILHDDLRSTMGAGAAVRYLPSEALVEASDILIAFGGDGTILSAARMVGCSKKPILGVNMGKLGFMAEASLSDLEAIIGEIVRGEHRVEERMLLAGTLSPDAKPFYALNDVVIDNSRSSRLIDIAVYVDDDYLVSYSGDGIILATPTGSTAYSLAAGGPIVAPTTGVILVQPISPHSLSARTVVVPDSSIIRISVEQHQYDARVTADGQQETTLTPPLTIEVRKANHGVKLIKRKDRSYYDVLREKLFWGSDIRTNKGRP